MSLRAAITRAMPDAEASAARVRLRGAEPVIAPLLEIAPRAFDTSVAGAQALVFTSANGVRSFALESSERAIPVLTVGDASAQTARALGFANVRSADGDVAALAALAHAALDPAAGAIVHIAGADLAGDLVGDLVQAGFRAERRTAYQARAVQELPAAFAQPLDIVLFYSARAARTFLALGAPGSGRLTAACLSAAVAEAAAPAQWGRLIVAGAPREDALIAAALP